ncbi:MAG: hypothetical protein LBC80_00295 [Treponema sp.]|jgi:hypothetical protein|nr:hypothetical protein [Treponema sp.]
MKKIIISCVLVVFLISGVSAQMTVSGLLDSTISLNAGKNESDLPDFTYGFEQFANMRFQSRLREGGTIFGAVNLIAASGIYAINLEGLGTPTDENFVAAIELERLHYRLRGDHIDFDGGLMRLPFGYSQVWGSTDFLNPRNPLKPDARPRGILGVSLTWFPTDELKLLGFFASPRDSLSVEGKGSLFGFSVNHNWNAASVQALYSFETPNTGTALGIHRAGLSIKADVEIGLVIDALYSYDYNAGFDSDGLSLSLGADYSFFDGSLLVLAEYLYNGGKSSTAAFNSEKNLYESPFKHNLYTGFTWRFNDFTNLNVALVSSFKNMNIVLVSGYDDINFEDTFFTPMITLNHNFFQGVVFTFMVQTPFDTNEFSGVICTAKIRLRF